MPLSVQAKTDLLVGDVFLSAACIAYYGAFTGQFRQDLVDGWIARCKQVAVPVSGDCTLRGVLASPVEVSQSPQEFPLPAAEHRVMWLALKHAWLGMACRQACI